jgi:hypothetical protein
MSANERFSMLCFLIKEVFKNSDNIFIAFWQTNHESVLLLEQQHEWGLLGRVSPSTVINVVTIVIVIAVAHGPLLLRDARSRESRTACSIQSQFSG